MVLLLKLFGHHCLLAIELLVLGFQAQILAFVGFVLGLAVLHLRVQALVDLDQRIQLVLELTMRRQIRKINYFMFLTYCKSSSKTFIYFCMFKYCLRRSSIMVAKLFISLFMFSIFLFASFDLRPKLLSISRQVFFSFS